MLPIASEYAGGTESSDIGNTLDITAVLNFGSGYYRLIDNKRG